MGLIVPIYEYYCRGCHGRFSHLARRMDAAAPPCPRCGNEHVERLISASHLVHGEAHHTQALREEVGAVDREDPQAAARALKASGRLEDAAGLYGSKAYRELIERRIEGAADDDLADLVDDLVGQAALTEAAQMAGAVALADKVDNRLAAEGPPEHVADDEDRRQAGSALRDREHGEPDADRSRRKAPDLGWG